MTLSQAHEGNYKDGPQPNTFQLSAVSGDMIVRYTRLYCRKERKKKLIRADNGCFFSLSKEADNFQ